MGTKVSIRSREPSAGLPGFKVYEDALDSFGSDGGREAPVYLELSSVDVRLETMKTGGALVTVALPRAVARDLGLLPGRAPPLKPASHSDAESK